MANILRFSYAAAADLADSDAANRGPLYLLAHCRTRAAARTFQLDRIELC